MLATHVVCGNPIFLYMTPNVYSFCLSIKLSVFLSFLPFSFSSLPCLCLSLPPSLPAPGSVSSFTEQLKVTGTEREGEGGRDRGRTHHSIARGYTTVEEEREMEGQREKRGETHESTHREFHTQVMGKWSYTHTKRKELKWVRVSVCLTCVCLQDTRYPLFTTNRLFFLSFLFFWARAIPLCSSHS